MTIAEQELAMIGFGGGRRQPAVWNVVRLDTALPVRTEECEAAASEALMYWRKLLARKRGRSPYRIQRVRN